MMKLVTKLMNEPVEGKLKVWQTDGPLEELALELAVDLTAGEERLVAVDAAGCFDPSRVSRAGASVGRNLHVIRLGNAGELQATLSTTLRSTQQRTGARRVLITGALDHLYSRGILARDAARALGHLKRILEEIADEGVEVIAVCRTSPSDAGVRSGLLSSLCAAAHEVHQWSLASQEYVDGASAAIA